MPIKEYKYCFDVNSLEIFSSRKSSEIDFIGTGNI